MANKYQYRACAIGMVALLVAACGGGDSGSEVVPEPTPEPTPLPGPTALKATLISGTLTPGFDTCESTNGTASSAIYSYLVRAFAQGDSLFLVESGEKCSNFIEPRIREINTGIASTHIVLHTPMFALGVGNTDIDMPQYPSAVHVEGNRTMVTGTIAAKSYTGFEVDEAQAQQIVANGIIDKKWFMQGTYFYEKNPGAPESNASPIAGSHALPAVLDGIGSDANFYAPHDLEVAANGLAYVIDDGLIRTIDADGKVTTLPPASYGSSDDVQAQALDVDLEGNLHAIVKDSGAPVWVNLTTGKRVPFYIPEFTNIGTWGYLYSFAVVGDEIIVSHRERGGDEDSMNSWLYRVDGNGTHTYLSGNDPLPVGTTEIADLTQVQLPQVQHVEYAANGALYLVLEQGVLRIENFK